MAREVIDTSLAVKAHTFALAAEDSFNAQRYDEASTRHATAHGCFDKVARVVEGEGDAATAAAMALLAEYHRNKSKEMRRRAKAAASPRLSNHAGSTSSAATSSADSGGETAEQGAPAPASAPTASQGISAIRAGGPGVSNSGGAPQQSSIKAFNLVVQQYGALKDLIEEDSQDSAAERNAQARAAQDAAEAASNSSLMQRALGDSFFVVPRGTRVAAGPASTQGGAAGLEAGSAADMESLIQTLQEKVRVLSRENANLAVDLQAAAKALAERNEQAERFERFRYEYTQRFAMLKMSMQHFQEAYAQGDSDGRRALLEKRLAEAVQRVKQSSKRAETERSRRKAAELRVLQLEGELELARSELASRRRERG